MDARQARTEHAIREAFLALRSELPLEKVSVTGLVRRAGIGKATFYLHYRDVYDLSQRLDNSPP